MYTKVEFIVVVVAFITFSHDLHRSFFRFQFIFSLFSFYSYLRSNFAHKHTRFWPPIFFMNMHEQRKKCGWMASLSEDDGRAYRESIGFMGLNRTFWSFMAFYGEIGLSYRSVKLWLKSFLVTNLKLLLIVNFYFFSRRKLDKCQSRQNILILIIQLDIHCIEHAFTPYAISSYIFAHFTLVL